MLVRWISTSRARTLGALCQLVVLACAGTPVEAQTLGEGGGSSTSGEDDGTRTTTTRTDGDGSGSNDGSGETTGPNPSGDPSGDPSGNPSGDPSGNPTGDATNDTTGDPTGDPSGDPSSDASGDPSGDPSTSSEGAGEDTDRPCDDPVEPNQNFDQSVEQSGMACNSGAAEQFQAVLDGSTSPDWFWFYGEWSNLSCDGDPVVTVNVVDDPSRELCVLPTCVSDFASSTDVTCTTGGEVNGRCCGPGTISLTANCVGSSNESLYVDIIVEDDAAACESLTFEYRYAD